MESPAVSSLLYSFFRRADACILLGFVLGLGTGFHSPYTSSLAMISLAALMTFSLAPIRLSNLKGLLSKAPLAMPFSFIVFSGSLLLIGLLFPAQFWPGWVLMASVPSAISVIPYTAVLRGDSEFSLVGTMAVYLAALVLTPLLVVPLSGAPFDRMLLVVALFVLILVPLAISRGLRRTGITDSGCQFLRNLSFVALNLLVIGAARNRILEEPVLIVSLLIGCGLSVLISYAAASLILSRLSFSRERKISLSLFSTYKNQGLAATLALSLFGPIEALPPVVMGIMEVIWITTLVRLVGPRDS